MSVLGFGDRPLGVAPFPTTLYTRCWELYLLPMSGVQYVQCNGVRVFSAGELGRCEGGRRGKEAEDGMDVRRVAERFHGELQRAFGQMPAGPKRVVVEHGLLDSAHAQQQQQQQPCGLWEDASSARGVSATAAALENRARANVRIAAIWERKTELDVVDLHVLRKADQMEELWSSASAPGLGHEALGASLSASSSASRTRIVFVISAHKVAPAKLVAENIRALLKRQQQAQTKLPTAPQSVVQFEVVLVCGASVLTQSIFESERVSEYIRCIPLRCMFWPIESDLLTLDLPGMYHDLHVSCDTRYVTYFAESLAELELSLELDFRVIRSAGSQAAAVCDKLLEEKKFLPEFEAQERSVACFSCSQDFAHRHPWRGTEAHGPSGRKRAGLIVIDRGVDPVTPLVTQWTYEGLLDEVFGIQNDMLDIPLTRLQSESAVMIGQALEGSSLPLSSSPPSLSTSPLSTGIGAISSSTSPISRPQHAVQGLPMTLRKRLCSETDRIFGQLRDLNLSVATKTLGLFASSVRDYYRAKPDQVAEMREMKSYLLNLRQYQLQHKSVSVHTALAAEISARTFQSRTFKERHESERALLKGSITSQFETFVLDAIGQKRPMLAVLRILALWSCCNGGISMDKYANLYTELASVYGAQRTQNALHVLERSMLLWRSQHVFGSDVNLLAATISSLWAQQSWKAEASKQHRGGDMALRIESGSVVAYNWQVARAALKLLSEYEPPDSVSMGSAELHQDRVAGKVIVSSAAEAEQKVAGCYSGYIPLTFRLVEAGLSAQGWNKLPHLASEQLLPRGHTMHTHEQSEQLQQSSVPSELLPPQQTEHEKSSRAPDIWVVAFVGGVCRAEASTIRWHSASSPSTQVIIATSAIITGNTFLHELISR
ncbi:Vacuolar protein-sorting-associated protein 33-like [Porphyridium purpureum]|uniref:Vacuolar protein-sorting-associated protein 33-like n=1 Tax=Porphyridium purpureum TaxID=35688 RepID=A0A5J4YME3_PORPP|nr:Vacuolar protein-sorting-associated protein 33-like [Porphyridium purpureum]|eukprot:POR4826..scf295_9